MTSFSKIITLFLMDGGDPNGRWQCKFSNWNGTVYKIPRKMIKDCTENPDLRNVCGVYFLFGYNLEQDKQLIYVGETEDIFTRLKQHLGKKDYWNEVIVFISNEINKANMKYLEYLFYSTAVSTGRYIIMNSSTPRKSTLSEAEEAVMEEFIHNAKIIVNTLGHKVFESLRQAVSVDEPGIWSSDAVFYITTKSKKVQASGMPSSDGFVVFHGSSVSATETKSLSPGTRKLRAKLILERKIVDHIFAEDVLFTSSSAASDCILGMSSSGPTRWKTNERYTLKQIEEGESRIYEDYLNEVTEGNDQ